MEQIFISDAAQAFFGNFLDTQERRVQIFVFLS